MHHANYDKSERLQRTERVLSTGRWYSTLELIILAKICAVSSVISELRRNGFDIECRRVGNVYQYQLKGR